jgi:hypothetical protein
MFGLNWGNGFITDRDIISSRGLSNPNAFFQRLLKKPYVKKVSAYVTWQQQQQRRRRRWRHQQQQERQLQI